MICLAGICIHYLIKKHCVRKQKCTLPSIINERSTTTAEAAVPPDLSNEEENKDLNFQFVKPTNNLEDSEVCRYDTPGIPRRDSQLDRAQNAKPLDTIEQVARSTSQ